MVPPLFYTVSIRYSYSIMRVLVISDIHGNAAALQGVLGATKNQWDQAVCLGDLVGYGPDPDECVDLVRRTCTVILAGNHDLAAYGGIDISDFSHHARRAMEWTRSRITASTVQFLKTLHPIGTFQDTLLSHGSPVDPVWSYIFSAQDALEALRDRQFSLCLFGHSHIPSAFILDGKKLSDISISYGEVDATIHTKKKGRRSLINPGSVGFPRDAADAHAEETLSHAAARFGILDTESGLWQFKRTTYDMRDTAQRMVQLGLW
jgi:predicted phosphodiesterase